MAQHDLFGKSLLDVMQRESDHITVLHRLALKKNQIGLVLFPSGNLREGIVTSADELLLQLTDDDE